VSFRQEGGKGEKIGSWKCSRRTAAPLKKGGRKGKGREPNAPIRGIMKTSFGAFGIRRKKMNGANEREPNKSELNCRNTDFGKGRGGGL